MMKKIIIPLLLALILLPAMLCGQRPLKGPKIEWMQTHHDFDTIQEVKGNDSCRLWFRNTGDAPLRILRTSQTCGCTASYFPLHDVMPGDSDFVTVVYHAFGRPGPFAQTINVYDNIAPKHRTSVFVTGFVRGYEDTIH